MATKKTILIVSLIIIITGICSPAMAATQAQINAAEANGIAWLAAQQNMTYGYWQDGSNWAAPTGLALIALQERAFELAMEPNSNIDPQLGPFDPCYPYKQNVEKGLAYLFSQMSVMSISIQPHGNPDTDGDGNGVCVNAEAHTYDTGIALMAIAASRAPDREVNSPGSPVHGWTYKRVLQNMVDYMAFGQNDSGSERGGWGYYANYIGWSDNSNSGYAVLGLGFAELPPYGFNCAIPQFVKDELNIWIGYIQVNGGPDDGASMYSLEYPSIPANILKTGNLIFEMTFVGKSLTDPDLQRALAYIGRKWNDSSQDPGWGNPAYGSSPHCQAMFCVMHGLEYAGINTIIVDGNGRDWYADFADALVDAQQPAGYWPNDPYGGSVLATEWALLTLEKSAPSPPPDLIKVDDVNDNDCRGPGDYITYTIDYNYPNEPDLQDINDVNIIDHLPPEVDFNSASAGGVYNSDACSVTWNIGTLHPGDSGSVTLTVIVRPCIQPCSMIRNECKLKSGSQTLAIAYEDTPVCCPTLTKEDDVSGCVMPDVNITYTICYAANGYGDTNVKIDDNLPPEVNFVSATGDWQYNSGIVTWNIGTLEPNESGCVTLTVKVKPCIEPSSTIINQCTMTGDCIHDITAYENTPVCPNYPTLTKVDDISGCVGPGETISYSICYAANGYGDTNVEINDILPNEVNFISATGDWQYNSGIVTWDIGTLEPNESGCVTLTVKVKPCIEPSSTIINQCEMTGDCIHDITAYENTPVCPNPTLTKEDNISDYVEPGDEIHYNICYAANGYGDTNVVITDFLPEEVNYVSSDPCGTYHPDSNTVTWNIDFPQDAYGCIDLIVQAKPGEPDSCVRTNHCKMTGDCIHDINAYEETFVFSASSYPNEVMVDNPVLWLRFEQAPFVDSSGNDYWVSSAAIVGETAGSLGKAAYLFSGSWIAAANQQTEPNLPVDYNHDYAFAPNDISFELWFKADAGLDNEAVFFTQAETDGYSCGMSYCYTDPNRAPAAGRYDTQMRAMTYPQLEEDYGWRDTEPNVWPTDGHWHHLVVTYDEHADGFDPNLRVKMYLDAELVIDDANSGDGVVGPEMDHILIGNLGSRSIPADYAFKGYIDDFAIYPGVLSPCRVAAHYAAWQPRNCNEIWDRGLEENYGTAAIADMNRDCKVDFEDFALLALDWATYADPNDPNSWNY